jgi:hypothetical protein
MTSLITRTFLILRLLSFSIVCWPMHEHVVLTAGAGFHSDPVNLKDESGTSNFFNNVSDVILRC